MFNPTKIIIIIESNQNKNQKKKKKKKKQTTNETETARRRYTKNPKKIKSNSGQRGNIDFRRRCQGNGYTNSPALLWLPLRLLLRRDTCATR